MLQKRYKILFYIFFLLGILLLIKPIYFYSKGFLAQHLLINHWDDYNKTGIIEKNWFDVKPIGKLSIDNISLEHIVLDGSSSRELSYGLGIVSGSGLLHEKKQNIVIAGHRDSFFKKLQYISKNDKIILEHIEGKSIYIVESMVVVNPFDLEYVINNDRNSLKLVTCFPFDFIGDAPKRFIVECSLLNS